MRKIETWLTGLLWLAAALLLPMAGLARADAPAFGLGACDDGSAHLAMGCASIAL